MKITPFKVLILVLSVAFLVADDTFCNEDWDMVVAGSQITLAIRSGSLYFWGWKKYGPLGETKTSEEYQLTPTRIMPQYSWKYIATSVEGYFSFAITDDGKLFAWGLNKYGQLGNGNKIDQYTPIRVGSDSDWSMIAAGGYHTIALKKNGALYAWGSNNNGQLGTGDYTAYLGQERIWSNTTWKCVSAGMYHSLAIRNDGALFAFGDNEYGQCGIMNRIGKINSPQRVVGKDGREITVSKISSGFSHNLAIDTSDHLLAWGKNTLHQLGQDSTEYNWLVAIPPKDQEYTKWKAIAAGGDHSLAVKEDGSLWSFGSNTDGQLGNGLSGSYAYGSVPVRVGNGTTWKTVSGGSYHSFGMDNYNGIIGWGKGLSGQLGDNTTLSRKEIGQCYRSVAKVFFTWKNAIITIVIIFLLAAITFAIYLYIKKHKPTQEQAMANNLTNPMLGGNQMPPTILMTHQPAAPQYPSQYPPQYPQQYPQQY